MTLDVVKSKSILKIVYSKCLKAFLVITILIHWSGTIKKIIDYLDLNKTHPIKIETIYWETPLIKIKFTKEGANRLYVKKIPYLKVLSEEHFNEIKDELKSKITSCFYKSSHPEKLFLYRPFPFKKIIYSILLTLTYPLAIAYLPKSSMSKSSLIRPSRDKTSPSSPTLSQERE
jgi:hypothetical protein